LRIRPEVVLACEPVDVDIIVEHLDLQDSEKFDLLVATNIFVYYDAFEQMLALENAGAMLKRVGFFSAYDRLPEIPGGAMRLAGTTDIRYDDQDPAAHEVVGWYQKR
jgi:predicted TPR repeat methyltransferase